MNLELDFLVPGGALAGPLMAGIIRDLEGDRPLLNPSERVGPFEIIRELGRGGSGTVYLAKRVGSDFHQHVAIKVVRTNELLKQAFRVERRILASFQHPNIARLIDGGDSGDGFLWLAMEFVDGTSIQRYCRDNKLDWQARIRLMSDVLNAIQYAHGHLIVHGDIKPENIMVDGFEGIRLLDFGVSSLKSGTDSAHRGFTPRWASPEQLGGDELTASSDIYQLGLLMKALLLDEPGLHMSRLKRKELKAIVDIATKAAPRDRYQDVKAMLGDLGRLSKDLSVSAIDACWYRAVRFCRRNLVSIAMGVFGATALLVALQLAALQLREQSLRELLIGAFSYENSIADPS